MAAPIQIEIRNLEKLREFFQTSPQRVRLELNRALQTSAILIQRFARQEAPVDTGPLRNSITIRQTNLAVTVGPTSKYAVPLHEGSKPHWVPIKAFTGKEEPLDRWARRHGIPAFAVAKSISRKGTKPNKYMERAAERSSGGVQRAFDKAVDNVVGGA